MHKKIISLNDVKAEYHNSISYYESYGQVLFMLDNNAKLVKEIQITIK